MKSDKRRKFLKGIGAAGIAGLAGCTQGDQQASTQEQGGEGGTKTGTPSKSGGFPQHEITVIVPWGTGGGYDYYARLVAKYVNEKGYLPNGAKMRVVNKAGGGGIIGHNAIYDAKPDGYTIGIWYPPGMARAQVVKEEARYKMSKLTAYPSVAGRTPAVAVGKETDLNTPQDLVTAIKNESAKIYTSGVLSAGLLIPLALGRIGNLYDPQKVLDNYVVFPKGKNAGVTAVKRGNVQVMAGSSGSVAAFIPEVLKWNLIISTSEKFKMAPDVPTLADIQIDNPKKVVSFAGGGKVYRVFAGPPGIPKSRANVVREAITKAIKDPQLQKEAKKAQRPVNYASSETANEALDRIIQTWQENEKLLRKLMERA